jgi:hypothetical protein
MMLGGAPVAVLNRKRLLTNDEYHQMLEAGILAEEERVELIHGEIRVSSRCLFESERISTTRSGAPLMLGAVMMLRRAAEIKRISGWTMSFSDRTTSSGAK